jgi:hypothetical protein
MAAHSGQVGCDPTSAAAELSGGGWAARRRWWACGPPCGQWCCAAHLGGSLGALLVAHPAVVAAGTGIGRPVARACLAAALVAA